MFSEAELVALDERAAVARVEILSRRSTEFARPVYDLNITGVDGQSEGRGAESWPVKSTEPRFGNMMLGDSFQTDELSRQFNPAGGKSVLKPLVAVVQTVGGRILSAEETVALVPRANVSGEAPAIGAVNTVAELQKDRFQNSSRVLIGAARSAASILQLAKGGVFYGRLIDGVRQVKAIADLEGKTCGLTEVHRFQGETEIAQKKMSGAQYEEHLEREITDKRKDIAAITGQTEVIPWYLVVPGGRHGEDTYEIGSAQWRVAERLPAVFIVASSYCVIKKSGHLDANGSRWIGQYMAMVQHKTQTLGEIWKPSHMLWACWRGRRIVVGLYLPVPPAQLRKVPKWLRLGLIEVPDRGFYAEDASGPLPITDVRIAGEHLIEIGVARDAAGVVKLRYADWTHHQGHGNVCDSNDFPTSARYEYLAGSGDFPEAKIPELIGRPFPLQNFLFPAAVDVGPAEATLGASATAKARARTPGSKLRRRPSPRLS